MSENKNDFKNYQDFMNEAGSFRPVASVTEKIRAEVMLDLRPSLVASGLQLLLIHMVMGSLTLTICPQFGLGPIGGGMGLMGMVEAYGTVACGLFCGAFFFSGTLLISALLLSRPVKNKLMSHGLVTFISLAVLSLISLIIFSSMLSHHHPHTELSFIFAWLLAGIGFSWGLSQITFKTLVRQKA